MMLAKNKKINNRTKNHQKAQWKDQRYLISRKAHQNKRKKQEMMKAGKNRKKLITVAMR